MIQLNIDLKGQHALVCGSTQGIGNASARVLASMGADITLMARNEEKLRLESANLSSEYNVKCDYIVADFTNVAAVEKAIVNYPLLNTITILVNNTGGPAAGPLTDATLSQFLSAFEMHLLSNHALCKHVVPSMIKAGYGRIINVISTSVKIPLKGLGVSNTIRGAVANWSKTLANELAQHGITVNNVLPGATMTSRLNEIAENKANKQNTTPESVLQHMADEVPMKRVGRADEIASAIGFLASPAASYITGINLPVDGGRTGSL